MTTEKRGKTNNKNNNDDINNITKNNVVVLTIVIIIFLPEWESLSEFDVASLTRQLLLGLQAMHEKGVVHAQLTPNNVIYDAETQALKIADICLHRLVGEQSWHRMIKRFPGQPIDIF